MTQLLQLRSGTAGAPFLGANDLDTLLWDNALRAWYVGPGGAAGNVTSVFGRVGAVVAATGDYDGDQVDNVSGVPGASLSDALDYLLANAGAVGSVFGRVGAVIAATGDYDSDQIDNASGVTGASVSDALDALQHVSSPSRALGRGSAGGAGPVQELAFTGGLSVVGTNVTIADGALTVAKLAVGTAAGQSPMWDGTAWRLIGLSFQAALTNADEIITVTAGASLLTVALTANRNKTLSLTGQSVATKRRVYTIYNLTTLAFDLVVKDDGGTTLHTFVATTGPFAASFSLNDLGTAWTLSGWAPFGAIV